MTGKWCGKCQREKAVRHFHRDAARRDGYYPHCKSCRRVAQAASYRRHAAAHRAGMRAYYAAHRADVLARQRAAYHADLAAARELKRLHGANRAPRRAA